MGISTVVGEGVVFIAVPVGEAVVIGFPVVAMVGFSVI